MVISKWNKEINKWQKNTSVLNPGRVSFNAGNISSSRQFAMIYRDPILLTSGHHHFFDESCLFDLFLFSLFYLCHQPKHLNNEMYCDRLEQGWNTFWRELSSTPLIYFEMGIVTKEFSCIGLLKTSQWHNQRRVNWTFFVVGKKKNDLQSVNAGYNKAKPFSDINTSRNDVCTENRLYSQVFKQIPNSLYSFVCKGKRTAICSKGTWPPCCVVHEKDVKKNPGK